MCQPSIRICILVQSKFFDLRTLLSSYLLFSSVTFVHPLTRVSSIVIKCTVVMDMRRVRVTLDVWDRLYCSGIFLCLLSQSAGEMPNSSKKVHTCWFNIKQECTQARTSAHVSDGLRGANIQRSAWVSYGLQNMFALLNNPREISSHLQAWI